MTNSTAHTQNLSTLHSSLSTKTSPLSTTLSLLGLIFFGVMTLIALISWNSPIAFFSFLAATFLCIDPLRNQKK